MRIVAAFGVAVALVVAGNSAYATLIGDDVDITVMLDLPTLQGEGARVLEDLDVVVDNSVELTLADQIANPGNYKGAVDVDIDGAANQIIISVSETFASGLAAFETIDIWVEDLDWIGNPGSIVGTNVISDNLIFNTASDPYAMSISFTADSVHISWESLAAFNSFFIQSQGQAVIGLEVQHDVPDGPESSSIALMGFGFAGMALRRRFKA